MTDLFLELLNVSLGNRDRMSLVPNEREWYELFDICQKQSVTAFVLYGIDCLGKERQQLPQALVLEWIGTSEQVKYTNNLMNNEAARLTKLFEEAGHKTVILKGQANARLYPRPYCRQSGDIDMWLDGGREKVIATLRKLGLLTGELKKYKVPGVATLEYHHIDLPKNENGVDVELHFRPTSGNLNPFKNKKLQVFLEKEISVDNLLIEEGFRVPSNRFSIVMQLSHIQRHFISEGVGMRQIIDYFYLLKSCKHPKQIVSKAELKLLGLHHTAGALMWLLYEKLGLDEEFLIYTMDEKRGKMLLQTIIDGGNFGYYYTGDAIRGSQSHIVAKHEHRLKMLKFDASETVWQAMDSIWYFVKSIPERIRRRKWSLG